jgi:hypothetical protein
VLKTGEGISLGLNNYETKFNKHYDTNDVSQNSQIIYILMGIFNSLTFNSD